ncbi:hypothetical protein [Photobacterium sp. TLY01]|uniref:hypothetical protein n=1 Tax=Photobacterium sp. TLY01 TaxID=2907534 RepID=UPI001F29940C|nr:hypothetical protein [Photobacterium sp. TLY01]UIP27209.1 hypothetical protein LN341_11260 [Photobacterium sp. TLY01]
MMDKRIYIHFGPGKTGSSAIQAWMNSHRGWLAEQQVCYPAHAVDKNSVSSGNIESVTVKTSDGQYRFSQAKANRLLQSFQASHARVLFLSSEFFFPMLSQLMTVFKDATFIGYIRDPLDLHESDYNQKVKLHGHYLPFHAPISSFPVVGALAQVLDSHKEICLDLRPYGKGMFTGGDIVKDILAAIGLEYDISVNTGQINRRYGFEALEFKRLLNYFPIAKLETTVHDFLQSMEHQSEAYSVIPVQQQKVANENHCQRLAAFIKNRHFPALEPLLRLLRERQLIPYRSQDASQAELSFVCDSLKEYDMALYLKLQSIVSQHRFLYVDTPFFMPCFIDEKRKWWKREPAKKFQAREADINGASLSTLVNKVQIPDKFYPPHILASMGEFAFANHELEFAERLFTEALKRNPKQILALRYINDVRLRLRGKQL